MKARSEVEVGQKRGREAAGLGTEVPSSVVSRDLPAMVRGFAHLDEHFGEALPPDVRKIARLLSATQSVLTIVNAISSNMGRHINALRRLRVRASNGWAESSDELLRSIGNQYRRFTQHRDAFSLLSREITALERELNVMSEDPMGSHPESSKLEELLACFKRIETEAEAINRALLDDCQQVETLGDGLLLPSLARCCIPCSVEEGDDEDLDAILHDLRRSPALPPRLSDARFQFYPPESPAVDDLQDEESLPPSVPSFLD